MFGRGAFVSSSEDISLGGLERKKFDQYKLILQLETSTPLDAKEAISRSYRILMRDLHPDKDPSGTKKQEYLQILRDKYDIR
jgi:hypothetical protein